ncbi:3-oxoacid CoA-transferase subunit B [Bordetella sp. N]|uniref:3-oxoacid CoA-transferase subunit B n=1 Tax=Bordetella sp. N TaxID=1746199 RepID=UPI000710EDF1|nr:3-oxoacid CoA-transferase subunit B [Bordetella sp. N]ALM83451.1 3-oxoadipate CoA-transferase [Bordetella sp. N]
MSTTTPAQARPRLTRQQIAQLVAYDIPDGSVANLGIGIPTLVSDYLVKGREIVMHSENGILGMGGLAASGEGDPDLINASRQLITLLPGASISEHTVSFAMMRGGHLDYTVLGGFQVAQNGDLANWITNAEDTIPAVGGAMDLAVGARKVYVTMEHVARDGSAKLLERCTYPLTAAAAVDRVYTDMAVLDIGAQGFELHALLEGVTVESLQTLSDARLHTPRAPQVIRIDEGGYARYHAA